jgi:hypothetical protein
MTNRSVVALLLSTAIVVGSIALALYAGAPTAVTLIVVGVAIVMIGVAIRILS